MLNNYYFKDTEDTDFSIGSKGFKKECCDYLKETYNYVLLDAIEDSGLKEDELTDLYEDGMEASDYIDLLMEEAKRMKSNYFNIILAGERNL